MLNHQGRRVNNCLSQITRHLQPGKFFIYNNVWPRLFCLLFLSCSLASHTQAVENLVLDADKAITFPGKYSEYYEDSSSNLKIEDIFSTLYQNRFTAHKNNFFRFGFTDSTYWVRFRLKNPGNRDLTTFLKYENVTSAEVTAFSFTESNSGKKSGNSDSLLTNDKNETINTVELKKIVIDSNQVLHPDNHYIPVTVPSNSITTYYLKASSNNPLNFSLSLNSEKYIVADKFSSDFPLGIGVGLLIFLALTILFFFFKTKQSVYLFYGMFLLAVSGYIFSISGIIEQVIPPLQKYQDDFGELNMFFAIAFNIIFTQRLLDTKSISALLDQRLQILLICALFATLIPLNDSSSFSLRIGGILAALSMLMMSYAAAKVYKDSLVARQYLLARIPTIILTLFAIFSVYGFIPLPFTITWILLFALIMEATLMSNAMHTFIQEISLSNEAQRINAELETAKTNARTETIARISHDIRTPMSGILGMAEILEDTPLTPKQHDYLKTIKSSGESLLNIINNIMDYSKSENESTSLLTIDFELHELVDDCIDFFREKLEEKNIEFIVNIRPDVPRIVHGSREQLRQILINLITNGIKTIHKGNLNFSIDTITEDNKELIKFELSSPHVSLPQEHLGEIDNLINLEKKDLSHPYTELDMNLITASQGIRRMGGEVTFRHEHKQAFFIFNLDLKTATNQAKIEEPWEEKLKDLRLLIVDDNLACRQVIEQQATSWGMIISTASNGMEALAISRNNANLGEPFDIIVMDHNMPSMSGLELASRISEDPLLPKDCLCIMLTGLSIAPSDSMAKKSGIDKVITKPVSGRALKSSIAEELGFKEKPLSKQKPDLTKTIAEKNLHALVAEDHYLSQKVIQSVLSKLNIQATIVNNGKEAFDALQKQKFDIILMDCDMPGLNGFEATRKIRNWEDENHLQEIPIIALTAHVIEEYKNECLEAGMNDYISKPMDQKELEYIIDKWTQAKKPPPTLSVIE